MSIVNFQTTTNFGEGLGKVFKVSPGQTAIIRSSYFAGTTTNFFMAGPTTTSPHLWTFNLVVKPNTPADFYTVKSQMAGYDSASHMWSQQEFFYVQVVAAPPVPTLLAPQRSGSSFSVQVATNSGFTYYLEDKTDLARPRGKPPLKPRETAQSRP